MVEQVEGLGAELQRDPLIDGRHLGNGAIDIFEAGRHEYVAPRIAKAGSLAQECRRIDVAGWRAVRQITRHARHQEGPVEWFEAAPGVRDRDDRAEGTARLQVDDGRYAP